MTNKTIYTILASFLVSSVALAANSNTNTAATKAPQGATTATHGSVSTTSNTTGASGTSVATSTTSPTMTTTPSATTTTTATNTMPIITNKNYC